jgi:hypothetical protein
MGSANVGAHDPWVLKIKNVSSVALEDVGIYPPNLSLDYQKNILIVKH